jgi:hypothetical protein
MSAPAAWLILAESVAGAQHCLGDHLVPFEPSPEQLRRWDEEHTCKNHRAVPLFDDARVAERDAAMAEVARLRVLRAESVAEVARLRALCAEAVPSIQRYPSVEGCRCEACDLTARLVAAGKGEL